ncbi:hypothetical protein K435DRAFT_868631 [Dendrothele bispora CBS 962.96]|uniref:Uncharacterized protein n=1 Tax=Dendrothele bispora (strain CBS 962.96) TaxID=1314807 RepID=A0A4V4HD73_DENBC|nr:hypothetical protein K435DRAFT_868631 [Dendrothele bispora CBS 962.96]
MSAFTPHFPRFVPFTGNIHADPPSNANVFLTSDTRSTSSNLESNPPPHNSCPNCSSYHSKGDDEKFLQAMEEGRDAYRRRLEWIWYCICQAAPRADRPNREQVWSSLVESDDIWSIWEDGDDLNLPEAPIPQIPVGYSRRLGPEFGNLDFITPSISRKIDLHCKNRCTPKPTPSSSSMTQNTSVHMRLAIVLWKTILATRRVKYPRNPSSVNCEIPSLVPRWWDILPELVRVNLFIDDRSDWDRFCLEQRRRKHTCMEDLPDKKMWSTWITVQALTGTSVPLDIPLNDGNCPQCLKLRKQPFGRSEFVKPHVLALWGITEYICYLHDHPHAYPGNIWDSPCIFSHYPSSSKVLDLRKSLFNLETLHKVDEWLTYIWSSSDDSDDEFYTSDLRKHVGKTLDYIPSWLKVDLNCNENDLKPHWTETQVAISKISSSESSVGSKSNSVEPASWVSAVVLYALAEFYGLGPLTAQHFVYIIEDTCVTDLPEKAPLVSNTPPFKKFHEALRRSGHTCWSEKSCGPNLLTNLYFSAYSLLLDTSCVPVVGCEERYHWTKCTACHAKCAFHDLSLVLDEELLGPLQSLSDKDKKGRVKRLIGKLNYARYQNQHYRPPLNHSDLMMIIEKLGSLSNLFQYALYNGQHMGLLDVYGKTSLGFSPNIDYSYDCDSESNFGETLGGPSHSTILFVENPVQPPLYSEMETQNLDLSTISVSDSSVQSHQPVLPTNTSYEYPSLNALGSQEHSQAQNTVYAMDQTPYPDPLPLPFHHDSHEGLPLPDSMTHSVPIPLDPQLYSPLQDQSPPVQLLNDHHHNIFLRSPEIPGRRTLENSMDSIPNNSTLNPREPENTNLFQQPPFGLHSGGTHTSGFILETGKGHAPKAPNGLRVDEMRVKIKEQFLSMLKSHNIDTGDKLPWRNLFKTLEERKCQFENWPEGTPRPHTQNGIEKAPQKEIKRIYKALCDKEHPLRICRIDGRSGGVNLRFILQDPPRSGSGTKQSRYEQPGEIEERESSRRRMR